MLSRRPVQRGIICALCLAMSVALSCGGAAIRDDHVTTNDLGPVVNRHSQEIMQIPGVTGVAVGALEDGTPCILILVVEDSDEVRSRLPTTLEGHPVKVLETGRIEPLEEDSSS